MNEPSEPSPDLIEVDITVKYRRRVTPALFKEMRELTPEGLAQQDVSDLMSVYARVVKDEDEVVYHMRQKQRT